MEILLRRITAPLARDPISHWTERAYPSVAASLARVWPTRTLPRGRMRGRCALLGGGTLLHTLSSESVEDLYGSYRSLARQHRERDQWALAHYCNARASDCAMELSRRFAVERDAEHAQLDLVDELRKLS